MHFFGSLGLAGTSVGGLILLFCAVEKIVTGNDIVQEHGPLMMAGALLLLAGWMMFSTGLLGEVLMRTYFESQGRHIYAVRAVLTQSKPGVAGEAR
jgi:ammonia channel protein AmtB